MLRILYVEDNAANLSLVYRVAKMGGHEVINRSTGEKALADFDSINPDLVLMDVQLEGQLTGLDVTKELRARGYTLPIVAVTAYAMTGDREKAINAGCDDYLPKPLPIKQLVALLQRHQKQKNAKKASSKTVPAVNTDDTAKLTDPDTTTVVAPAIEDQEKTITTEAAKQLDPNATTTVKAAQQLDPNPTVTARATDANDVVEVATIKDADTTAIPNDEPPKHEASAAKAETTPAPAPPSNTPTDIPPSPETQQDQTDQPTTKNTTD
jgi:two-component system, cell cycle response regulator DivK